MRDLDTDDYKNLECVMNYIQVNLGLPLILSIDKSGKIKWYVDAVFSVHKDMRSHAGGFMNMVTVGIYVQSIKQKLSTKISTEANLFLVSMFQPM